MKSNFDQIFSTTPDEILKKIQVAVKELDEYVLTFNPVDLLKRAVNNYYKSFSSPEGSDWDRGIAIHTLEFLFNTFASSLTMNIESKKLDAKNWEKISILVDQIITAIRQYLLINYATNFEKHGSSQAEVHSRTAAAWWFLRGKKYSKFAIPHLRTLLSPHDKAFTDFFGITVDDFIKEAEQLKNTLANGLVEAKVHYHKFIQLHFPHEEILLEEGFLEKIDALQVTNPDLYKEGHTIAGKLFGLDTFRVDKITKLPKELITKLSWTQGEDVEFWEEGDFAGIPLRMTPLRKRPFININGATYCFANYHFFDSIYRLIERLLCTDPKIRSEWQANQKTATEDFTLGLIKQIFSTGTSKFYPSSFYGKAGKRQENDNIVIHDRVLFVFETKAVADLSNSPIENSKYVISKLNDMVVKPTNQGSNFLSELEDKKSLALYEDSTARSKILTTLCHSDFDLAYLFAVSIDEIGHVATKIKYLEMLGCNLKYSPIAISISDLAVYSEVFKDQPLQFIHYLGKRNEAVKLETLSCYDEMEYLSLYLKYNNIAMYVKEINANEKYTEITFGDSTDVVDSFFYHNSLLPKQNIPSLILEIFHLLEDKNKPNRIKVSNLILDYNEASRNKVVSCIENTIIKRSSNLAPIVLYSTMNLVIFCLFPDIKHDRIYSQKYVWATLMAHQKQEALSVVLTFDSISRITDIDFEFLHLKELPISFKNEVSNMAENYKQKKKLVKTNFSKHKVGRNELCPCGSGIKYKKCCL